jgi:hypothetical protein
MSKRLLFIGYIGDTTMQHMLAAVKAVGVEFSFIHLGDYYSHGYLRYSSTDAGRTKLCAENETYYFRDFVGIFQRLMLPDVSQVRHLQWPKVVSRFVGLDAALLSTEIKVINRPCSGWENMSKPLQGYLLGRKGFNVPESLTTSNVSDYELFRQNQETIYKSNSSVRSIVDSVDHVEKDRLQFLQNCPVLFQRRIVGKDVRIHIVDASCFAAEIESDAVDYRYYRTRGSYSKMHVYESVPTEIVERCISYAEERGVVLAGFDFKVDEAGNWYCLEMNPSPGFEFYDRVLEGKICRKVLEYLLGEEL